VYGALRRPMARAFESAENPLNHIGAMTVFFLWIVLISGIWLLIFFRTSVSGAFESVEYLTREQWYLGGIMRSLHRYSPYSCTLSKSSSSIVIAIIAGSPGQLVYRWFG